MATGTNHIDETNINNIYWPDVSSYPYIDYDLVRDLKMHC